MILLNEFVHMNVSEEFWDMFLACHPAGRDFSGCAAVLETDLAV